MNRCATCKFYSRNNPISDDPLGTCSRWHEGYHFSIKDVKSNEVLVENDEGWAALMGPDFGCVLHEPAS